MNYASKITLLLGATCLLFFTGCTPDDCEEEIPEIEFKSFERAQDSALLTISFLDCDGDIGLRENETDPPYDFNLFVSYLEWKGGEWVKLELDSNNDLKYRVPTLESTGNSDKLDGDIELTMLSARFGTADTVSYEIYLVDRALNESNRIRTPLVLFPD